MPSDVTVRRATLADLPALVAGNAAMAAETEELTLDRERLEAGVRALLAEPSRGFYLVAEAEGRPVGQLMITPEWSDWRNAFFWWIQSVYVDPAWRRRGVYRSLHLEAERLARAAEACGLRLYVDRGNAGAQATYRALGMEHSHYDLFEADFTR